MREQTAPAPVDDNCCRAHVRAYLRAPFLADEARLVHGADHVALHTRDVDTPGLPRSLQQALQEWAVNETTPDEDIASFIGWAVEHVREHR